MYNDNITEVLMVKVSRLDTVINLDILLSSNANLCSDDNIVFVEEVHRYIKESKRFP